MMGPQVGQAALLAVFLLAGSIWVGGYVAIAVVARVATATLEASARVAFFRSLGRLYLWIGAPALVVALGTGATLLRDHRWDGLLCSSTVLAAMLVALLAVAIAQARRMTRLRRRALQSPENTRLPAQVRRGGQIAGGLRAVLGVLSLALLVLSAFLAV